MKACFKCNRSLPLDEFYRHPMMGDGLLGKCKACARKDVQENRRAKSAYYREYDLQRYRAGRRPPPAAAEKVRARIALHNAVARGKIVKPKCCSVCRVQFLARYIEAHHTDYTKPLDVIWLCKWCHGLAHRMDEHRRAA